MKWIGFWDSSSIFRLNSGCVYFNLYNQWLILNFYVQRILEYKQVYIYKKDSSQYLICTIFEL